MGTKPTVAAFGATLIGLSFAVLVFGVATAQAARRACTSSTISLASNPVSVASGETITANVDVAASGSGCRSQMAGTAVTSGSIRIEENEVKGIGVPCGKGLCTAGTVGMVCAASDDCGAGGKCKLGRFVTISKGRLDMNGQLAVPFATGGLGSVIFGFRAHYVGGSARFHGSLSECRDLQIFDAVWPMFLHDARHTGQSPFDTSADTGRLEWSLPLAPETGAGSPAVGIDGTVYIGAGDSVYAVNPEGTEKWSFSTGGPVISTPAIGLDGTVYAVGSPGIANLNAIGPDGTEKWSVGVGLHTTTSPVVGPDGTIYVGARFALNAIDPDGTVQWQLYSGDIFGGSSPAVGYDGTIYVGAGYLGLLNAVNPDGSLKWRFGTAGGADDAPALGSDGTIYVGSVGLSALNPDGTEYWNSPGADADSSPAVRSNGMVYVGSDDGNLYAFNPDGTEKWSFATGSAIYSSPAIGSDGTIYVGSSDGDLYAINPDGTKKWSFATGGSVNSPAIGSDGTIYVGSADGNLYAIH